MSGPDPAGRGAGLVSDDTAGGGTSEPELAAVAEAPDPVELEARPGWGTAIFAVAVLLGLALRLWVVNSDLGPIDSDEAAGGLIALHITEGDLSTFLWGNAYGGTIEAFLAAPLLALSGASAVAWKSVMIVMYACACVLAWRVGLRSVGPVAARLGAALLWVAPAPLVLMSTKARLYYGATLVLTSAALLLCLRLAERRSRRDIAVLGLVVGLGIWTAPFVMYVFIPALAWLAVTRPARLRDAPFAVPGVLIGSAPWLIFNLRNGWISLDTEAQGIGTTYVSRLSGFFTGLLPRLLGLRSYSGEWQAGGVGKLLYVACLAAVGVLVLLWLSRRLRASTLLVIVLLAYPFLFALPQASWYVTEPRYGLFLAPTLALLVAAGITRVVRQPPAHLAVVALAAVASVAGLSQMIDFGRANPGHHDITPQRMGELGAALQSRGITTLVADYWIAYALVFETGERVIATPNRNVRYPPYDRRVHAAGVTEYVFFPGTAEGRELEGRANQQGIRIQREEVAGFDLYRLDAPLA